MKNRRLLALPVLVFALSCGDGRQPTGPNAPTGPSEIISDGAHCGGANPAECNRDFFFLPPLVPLPLGNPDFELGEFNNTLRLSLKIEICELELTSQNMNSAGRPSETTPCVAGDPLKEFAGESVNVVNLPRQKWGWWSLFNLPPDGFYYVLWNTRQSALDVNKYYRIKVFLIDGSTKPLGVADVDPMSSLRQWKYSATGEVVQMIDDVLLPIPFRVENGAESSAFCETGTECVAETVHNVNPDGSGKTIVRYEEGEVPLAGIKLTDGWAPEGVQSAVFIITRVNTGVNNVELGTQTAQCHANMDLQQFDACFNYRTVPDLGGAQFRAQVIAAVCFVLNDKEPEPDPREPWVQLWSSEPGVVGDVPKPLVSIDEGEILTNDDGRNCETQEVPEIPFVGSNTSNPLIRLANTGWGKLTRGMSRVFGVKTAYAVDFGLGGILDDLSNIGPALTAEFRPSPPGTAPVPLGTSITSTVRIVGTQQHDGSLLDQVVTPLGKTQGIPGLPVEFTLFRDGAPVLFGSTGTPALLTATTDASGFATVNWTPPSTAGTYSLRATGQAKGGPVEYSAEVTDETPISGLVNFETPDLGEGTRDAINPYTDEATGTVFSAEPPAGSGVVGIVRNFGTSVCVAPSDGNQKLGTGTSGSSIGLSAFPIRATFPTTRPAGTAVSFEVQTGDDPEAETHVELQFFDASGTELSSLTQPVAGPDVRCGEAPGDPRVKLTISTVVTHAFKYLIIVGPPGRVFVIDNFQIGTPPVID